MLVEAVDVELGAFPGARRDHCPALVVDVEHQLGGLLLRVAEELLEDEGHERHQVDRVVPYDDQPWPVRGGRLVDDGRHVDRSAPSPAAPHHQATKARVLPTSGSRTRRGRSADVAVTAASCRLADRLGVDRPSEPVGTSGLFDQLGRMVGESVVEPQRGRAHSMDGPEHVDPDQEAG